MNVTAESGQDIWLGVVGGAGERNGVWGGIYDFGHGLHGPFYIFNLLQNSFSSSRILVQQACCKNCALILVSVFFSQCLFPWIFQPCHCTHIRLLSSQLVFFLLQILFKKVLILYPTDITMEVMGQFNPNHSYYNDSAKQHLCSTMKWQLWCTSITLETISLPTKASVWKVLLLTWGNVFGDTFHLSP